MAYDLNSLMMDVFNLAKSNILTKVNILSWNMWFTAPEYVNKTECRNHAEVWRKSIDADHGSPEGPGTAPRYFDGKHFCRSKNQIDHIDHEIALTKAWLKKHLLGGS